MFIYSEVVNVIALTLDIGCLPNCTVVAHTIMMFTSTSMISNLIFYYHGRYDNILSLIRLNGVNKENSLLLPFGWHFYFRFPYFEPEIHLIR